MVFMKWCDALRVYYISKTNWNLKKNDNQIKNGKTVVGYKSFDEIQSSEHNSSRRFYFNNTRLQESVERLGANHAIVLALMLVFLPYDATDSYIGHCLLGLAWSTIIFSIIYISDILIHNLKYQYFLYDLITNGKEKYVDRITTCLFASISICAIYYAVKIVTKLDYMYLICFVAPILVVFIIFYYQRRQLNNELQNSLNAFMTEQIQETEQPVVESKEEEKTAKPTNSKIIDALQEQVQSK
eukprot:193077_1